MSTGRFLEAVLVLRCMSCVVVVTCLHVHDKRMCVFCFYVIFTRRAVTRARSLAGPPICTSFLYSSDFRS